MYAQHVPLMMKTVEAALKGRIKDNLYPSLGSSGGKSQEVGNITYMPLTTMHLYTSDYLVSSKSTVCIYFEVVV